MMSLKKPRQKNRQLKRTAATRRGAILICVMACLLVSLTLVATTMHMSLRARRECRVAHQMRQTDLLAEAGQLRAVSQLDGDAAYTGEMWQPSIASNLFATASVRIAVDRDSDVARVTVTALTKSAEEDDLAGRGSIQRTLTFNYQISDLSEAE